MASQQKLNELFISFATDSRNTNIFFMCHIGFDILPVRVIDITSRKQTHLQMSRRLRGCAVATSSRVESDGKHSQLTHLTKEFQTLALIEAVPKEGRKSTSYTSGMLLQA